MYEMEITLVLLLPRPVNWKSLLGTFKFMIFRCNLNGFRNSSHFTRLPKREALQVASRRKFEFTMVLISCALLLLQFIVPLTNHPIFSIKRRGLSLKLDVIDPVFIFYHFW